MFQRIIAAVLIGAFGVAFVRADDLAKDFASPPQSAHCWTYWYWHAKATKEGITRDLEAMHEQGIEGVLVFPFQQYMTPEWIPLFQHVLQEAERLNLSPHLWKALLLGRIVHLVYRRGLRSE